MIDANGIIRIDTSTTPPKGVEIRDLQVSLGRGTSDLGQLCSDTEWYDTGEVDQQGHPIYALRRVNKINEWASNKPVRSNILDVLTEAQIKAVNRGLRIPAIASLANLIGYINSEEGGTIPTQFSPASNGDTDPNFYKYIKYGWWYCSPRGKGNGSQGADEHFRIRDFENYDKSTGPLFTMEPQRTTIDSGSFFIDLYTTLDFTNPDYKAFADLDNNGLVFVVAVVKEGASASTAKFKTSPATLYGSTVYTVVEFTSSEVGKMEGGVNSSKVFTGGKGNYLVYGFLMKRTIQSLTPPFQNLDSSASGYVALNALPNCIALPCPVATVEFVDTPAPDPTSGLTFIFASGGTFNYNAANGRFTITFPALSVSNSNGSQKTITKTNIYVSVWAVYLGDAWSSEKSSLGLSGSTVVPANGTETVFGANSVTKVVSDATIIQFLQNHNATIGDCLVYATLYYLDPDTGDYWPMTSYDKPSNQ